VSLLNSAWQFMQKPKVVANAGVRVNIGLLIIYGQEATSAEV
jgi:hypothetical protein